MHERSYTEIESPMDESLDEGVDAMELIGDINLDDIDEGQNDASDDDIVIDDKVPEIFDLETGLQDVEVPQEVTDYIKTISDEARKLEDELRECDQLLSYDPNKHHVSTSVVLYDDMKEMEQMAAEMGLTVEQLKQKALQEMEETKFDEEDVENELQEFMELQKEFADLSSWLKKPKASDELPVLAIEGSEHKMDDKDAQGVNVLETDQALQNNGDNMALVKYEDSSSDKDHSEAKAVIRYNETIDSIDEKDDSWALNPVALSSMRDFIIAQLKWNEAWYNEKRTDMLQTMEKLQQEEETELLKTEERKKTFEEELNLAKEVLRKEREKNDVKLEEELKETEEKLNTDLSYHQTEIEHLSAMLEDERKKFEASQQQWQAKLTETQCTAAIKIQKVYRGHRTRGFLTHEMAELSELRELRKKEKHTLRVMEIEYELKLREEQRQKDEAEKRENEEKRKQEEEERKRKEEERITDAIRKEKERLEERDRLAEQQKKKDEEERKQEENRKKEEEENRKEEEKKRKEEEKKIKEEEKRKKEEEKKKKEEEEKRKKAEEKRIKEEEKKKKKEEEAKKKEESRKKQENDKLKEQEEKKITEEKIKKDQEERKSKEPKNILDEGNISSSETELTSHIQQVGLLADEGAKQQEQDHQLKSDVPNGLTMNDKTEQASSETVARSNQGLEALPPTLTEAPENKISSLANQPISKIETPSTPKNTKSESPSTPKNTKSESPSTPTVPTSEYSQRALSIKSEAKSSPKPILPPTLEPKPYKPSPTDLKRLDWMKSCIPWSKVSNEPWKLSQAAPRSTKVSTRRLPAVSEAVVLSAAQAETLRQVTCVTLKDLPGCSLSTLGQCWSLRYLTVNQCGLLSLDGLAQCRHLVYINAEHNHIENLDLRDLGNLQVACLSHNNIGTVHGLEGCTNLRWLDLSHNSITRIGTGLCPLRRLHTLDLSHNQLVNSQGLEMVVTCQRLLLDHNYLQGLTSLDKLCLLTHISVVGNNLLKIPELRNQVLLQSLHMDGNSLKSLADLDKLWLPLLHTLTASKNLLESCEGLDKLIMLQKLDVSSNQITDEELLTKQLSELQNLDCLMLDANPFVDISGEKYRQRLATSLSSSLTSIDGRQVTQDRHVAERSQKTNERQIDTDFEDMCRQQIKLHSSLQDQFHTQLGSQQSNKQASQESLCSVYYSFCDTSFKMAAEHRSAHEYGDLSVSSSISNFQPAGHASNKTAAALPSSFSPRPPANSAVNSSSTALSTDLHHKSSSSSKSNVTANAKAKFGQSFSSQVKDVKYQGLSETSSSLKSLDRGHSSSSSSSSQSGPRLDHMDKEMDKLKHRPQVNHAHSKMPANSTKASKPPQGGVHKWGSVNRNTGVIPHDTGFSSDSDSDSDGDSDVDGQVTQQHYKHIPHPPNSVPPQQAASTGYASERDKFEMALTSPPSKQLKPLSQISKSDVVCDLDMSIQRVGQANDPKDKFAAALLSEQMNHSEKSSKQNVSNFGITADVIGSHLGRGEAKDNLGHDLGADLDDFDFDNLDFDIDKYLDVGELDEILEKGWRPEDSPHIPHSYPVLGKINPVGETGDAADVDAAMPLGGIYNNSSSNNNKAHPPHHPTQAWRTTPSSQVGTKGIPHQTHPLSMGGEVHPSPSPSPSTVASAAETLGGGTVKSKKDELLDEWGFKDSRTAEMMLARAKKMKWNAERKKKLNKLDPQQRLQLFRKLEESGKIQSVRPPPAKVLPRKEYFQAREEEVQRQHHEKQAEEQTKVKRTYEWLHTQVGDYTINSSRINAGQAPLYAKADISSGWAAGYDNNHDNRKWSPGSDHHESASLCGDKSHLQARRFSIGESQRSGQTPTLPPIQTSSAPSSATKNERMSFRDAPVEKSGGWGGGKRRGKFKQ